MGLSVPRGLLVLVALGLLPACRSRTQAPVQPPPRLSLLAVGDILMHQDVKAAAERSSNGFPALWADLVPLFREADLAFGNLETPIAPATGRPGVPFQFNAPATLPPALRASGFTVLSTANNHAFDQGHRGIRETLDRLRAEQLVAVGSGEDRPRAETVHILERQGVKVAFLAFTDLLNVDLNRKATEPWVRPLDLEPACAAVREARLRADLVVVSVHWGNEYQRQPTRRQRDLARRLAEAGCDLILGHHPHVLQPAELLETEGRKTLVAYSLGNFISNQDRMYRADLFPVAGGDSRDGAALRAVFERRPGLDGRERVVLAEAAFDPLWTENAWNEARAAREIRVIRLIPAEARARAEVEALSAPGEGPEPPARRQALLDKQEHLRTLILRRRRITEALGRAFVP